MPQTTPTTIEALIEGNVSGQVAVGNYNLQVVADHGAVVHVAAPEARPKPRQRPAPILLRPRAFRGLLDRKDDAEAAMTALRDSLPVEICGPAGIGKSSLLRHLAWTVTAEGWADGVVYLSAQSQPEGDLLQALFEAFYECDIPCKPTDVQLRQFLQARQALVLMDDLELSRQGVESLLNAAPGCAFVLISHERCLWGEGRALTLAGLPPEDAVALLERGLERPLTPEERTAAVEVCGRLNGNPLRILQEAGRLREERRPVTPDLPGDATAKPVLAALPEAERRILAVLAALGGGPVGAGPLAGMADVPELEPAVQELLQRRLVQAHSPRYSLTGGLTADLERSGDLDPWRERALAYYAGWAEAHRADRAALLEESGSLRRLLAWAGKTGRWREALRIARVLEGVLLVAGRWSAWAEVLDFARQAAKAVNDPATEAWSLHQLGTRLLCLDDKAEARPLLERALEIREALGDRKGAAITRHNLGLIVAPPETPPRKNPPAGPRFLPWLFLPLLVVAVAGGWVLAHRQQPDQTDEPVGITSEAETSESPGETSTDMPAPTTDTPEVTSEAPDITDSPDPNDRTVEEPAGAPELEVSPARLGFKEAPFGSGASADRISLANPGTAPLEISRLDFGDNPDGAFEVESSCGDEIPPGGRCVVNITFDPPKPGRYRADLAIAGSGLRRIVPVFGTATETRRPVLLLTPTDLPLGRARTGSSTRAKDVRISNEGDAPLTIDGIDLRGDAAGDFKVRGGCQGEEIAPGDQCRLTVVFAPSAAGHRSAQIVVTDKAHGLQEIVNLTGEGAGGKEPDGKNPPGDIGRILNRVLTTSGCCIDGTLHIGISADDCRQRKGTMMPAIQADQCKAQKPEQIWCCINGDVFQSDPAECRKNKGTAFKTEGEAKQSCPSPIR
ncbi:MAG: choice-of-anchor D domain-containing protein [Thermoanaerobaculia bacterium]